MVVVSGPLVVVVVKDAVDVVITCVPAVLSSLDGSRNQIVLIIDSLEHFKRQNKFYQSEKAERRV